MAGQKINRLELLRLRKRQELVGKGISILTSKRDALLSEFRKVVLTAVEARKAFDEKLLQGERTLSVARAFEPYDSLLSQSLAAQRRLAFNFRTEYTWGVRISTVDFPDARRGPFDRGSAPGWRSPAVDESALCFEDAINLLVKCAVAEHRLSRVGDAVRKTSRRLNALEQKVLPQIQRTIEAILSGLEEKEREESFRLKRYKTLRDRAAQENGNWIPIGT
ncbi:MAG: V-type ATP synthase subunit D [Armatimonadetes bacterium]|nr:V-type ATP synthase subunit D [Armatimonadota bacterium]